MYKKMDNINITNPKEFNIGPLSIFYRDKLHIDGEIWPNVISFVWAQLMCNKTFADMIKNHKSGFSVFRSEYEKKFQESSMTEETTLPTDMENQITMLKLAMEFNSTEVNNIHKLIRIIESWNTKHSWRESDDDIYTLGSALHENFIATIKSKLPTTWGGLESTTHRKKSEKRGSSKSRRKYSTSTGIRKVLEDFLRGEFKLSEKTDIPEFPITNVSQKVSIVESISPTDKDSKTDTKSHHGYGGKYLGSKDEVDSERILSLEDRYIEPEDKISLRFTIQDYIRPDKINNTLKKLLLEGLKDALKSLEKTSGIITKDLSDLSEIKKDEKVKMDRKTNDALYKEWSKLGAKERIKYKIPLKPIFVSLMHKCRIVKFEDFFYKVYIELITYNAPLKDVLVNTSNLQLIYIDPFSSAAPLLGMGVLPNGVMMGPNSVGKVLMRIRKKFISSRLAIEYKRSKKAEEDAKAQFFMVYTFLTNLLKERDIPEFIESPNINEILKMIHKSARIHTSKNRSYVLFNIEGTIEPDPDDSSQKSLLFSHDSIRENLKKRGIADIGNIISVIKLHPQISIPPRHFLTMLYNENYGEINDLYEYEKQHPGSLVKFLRKKYLSTLKKNIDFAEKNIILRGFLTFMYRNDPEHRVPEDSIALAVDHELSRLSPKSRIALLLKIDELYQGLDSSASKEVGGEQKSVDKPKSRDSSPLTNLEDLASSLVPSIDAEPIETEISEFIENARMRGQLAPRISQSGDVEPAEAYEMIRVPNRRRIEKEFANEATKSLDLSGLDPKDAAICHALSEDLHPSTANAPVSKERISSKLIFSSLPGYINNFPLSPTARVLVNIKYISEITAEVIHRLFPTVLHAVCYLWCIKEFRIDEDEAYLIFLTAYGKQLVVDINLLDNSSMSVSEFKVKTKNLIPNDKFPEKPHASRVLLRQILFKSAIEKSSDKDELFVSWQEAYQLLMWYMNQNLTNIVAEALDKANSIKFENPKMMKLLLGTGDLLLIHKDKTDPVIGSGIITDRGRKIEGQNLAGNSLMALRDMSSEKADITNLSVDIINSAIDIMKTRLTLFRDLIELIRTEFDIGSDKVLDLAKGFIMMYQLTCGDGIPVPIILTSKLYSTVQRLFPKKSSLNRSKFEELLWELVKIMYEPVFNLSSGIEDVKVGCMFDIDEELDDDVKTEADKILSQFLKCLFTELGIKNIDKIPGFVNKMISQSSGRAKFIGKLKIQNLSTKLKENIISGKLTYLEAINFTGT